MSVQKIDYEDKIGLQNDENIPNKNKVTDEDMNEIKSKVNNNADELTTAQQNIEDLQSGQGTASGDITSLKNRVTALETDNTTNKQDINTLKTDNETNKSNIATLQTDNETNKTNISTLQEDVEEIESNITELQTEQTAQNKKIEEIDDNQIHITTEKANNINIKDASGQNAKIKLFGISKQETSVQGNNYFDINRANFQKGAIGEDGVTINPNAENYYTENYIELDKAKYFLYEVENNDWNKVFIYDNNKSFIRALNTRGTHKQQPIEFELADNEKYIRMHYYTTETANRKIMLSKDSAKEYEEFVPNSPSPEYPSEIENTGGNIDITVCNKNLINWNKIITDSQNTTNEGEYIKFYQSTNRLNIKDVFKENTQYAFTIIAKKDTANGIFQLYFSYTDGSTETIKIVCTNANTDYKQTFISQANKTIGFIQSTYTDETASYIKIEGTQLEVNNVATDYIENEQYTITFPLQAGQKLMKGDYLADDGIHHKRKQIELDGTENWVADNQAGSDTCVGWKILVDDYVGHEGDFAPHGDILCSHFIDRNTYNNELDGISGGWGKWIYIKIKKEDLSTPDLTGFKSFLAEQKTNGTPVTIEYPLTEETIEEYTEEQQTQRDQLQNAKTYKTVTNVFTDNAEVEMNYIADTKTYVDNEINSIKNQLNTINELLSTTTTSAMLLDNMQSDLESEVL